MVDSESPTDLGSIETDCDELECFRSRQAKIKVLIVGLLIAAGVMFLALGIAIVDLL